MLRLQSYPFMGGILLALLFFCVSCASVRFVGVEEPSPRPANSPPIPFEHPNILGRVVERPLPPLGPIPQLTRQSALACLAIGRPVYGIALANTNVRTETTVDSCRIGRAPRGTLLRVSGIYEQGELELLTSLVKTTATAESAADVGYEEDILPLFQRNCIACHGLAAQSAGLVVTEYDRLLEGGERGIVVEPGSVDGSMLWWQLFTNRMPVIGKLADEDKALVKQWIEAGAPKKRPRVRTEITNVWLELDADDFDDVPNSCEYDGNLPHTLVNADLIQLLSCGVEPEERMLTQIRSELVPVAAPKVAAASVTGDDAGGSTTTPVAYATSSGGITAAPLGIGPPQESDEFMIPKSNFCLEPRFMKLHEQKSITAMSFAPDGRLFMAIDDMPTGRDVDPLILLDANHPSRSIGVIDSSSGGGFGEILTEKGRITGLDYYNGALYVSLAGEVGVIPDGQEYKKLAGGFAIASQYFHANNGIVVSDGWVYVSAGGVRDGWSDGPIVGMDESGAMHHVSGGNRLASRIVRAPLGVLLDQRRIDDFETVARGVRNPYGLARGPDGRLWFTDNGATNVPDDTSAGDEVNVLNPRSVAPGTADGDTPFYGFPLVLTSGNPGWYTEPVIAMPNAGAPTGITWAYGTIFYAQYGVNPGLYRLASSGGQTIAERVMMGWPIVSLATAPDGSLWMGMGTGGVYRMTPC
ncbi:MAG: c-type cytochrome domain-containing protein [Chloroflexota bacterium]